MRFAANLLIDTVLIAGVIAAVVAVIVIGIVVAVIINKKKSTKKEDALSTENYLRPLALPTAVKPTLPEKTEEPVDPTVEEIHQLADELSGVSEEIDKLHAEIDETMQALEEQPEEVEEAAVVEEAEAVEEVAAVEEPEPIEEVEQPEEAEEAEEMEEPAESKPLVVYRTASEGKVLVKVRYNRSYTAKLIQSGDVLKDYYTEIKNELMRYKVSNRTSWRYETFRKGRKLLVKLAVRGKTLSVYFALNPADFTDTKYKIKDVSGMKSNAAVPTLYKIKNDRRCKYAKELIARLMEENGLVAGEERNEDYKSLYPYEEIEPLIDRKLVKLLEWRERVPDSEVGLIEVAEDDIPEEIANVMVPVDEEEEFEEEFESEEEVEEQPIVTYRTAPEGKVLVKARYNRSYTAKLIQSGEILKDYYTEIKNELMRYKVSNRTSWRYETFRKGRKLVVKLAVRGKTLNVYFALNPADYADTKYKVIDVSGMKSNAAVPTLYKIKNDRRCKYAKDLIAQVMQENGLVAGEEQTEDYKSHYPYEEIEPLIDRKLVKLLEWKEEVAGSEVGLIAVPIEEAPEELVVEEVPDEVEVPVEEVPEEVEAPVEEAVEEIAVAEEEEEEVVEPAPVKRLEPEEIKESVSVVEAEEIIADEDAEAYVAQSHRFADKTKKAIVNIDTLNKYFNKGETVTISEIKKRVPGINKKVTYIKVLGRGTIDKALTVEADEFSSVAIKMIVLTGGHVIRTK